MDTREAGAPVRGSESLQSAQLMQAMLENTQEALFICDGTGRIVQANEAGLLLDHGQPVGRLFSEAFPLELRVPDSLPVDMPAGLAQSVRGVEATLPRASGPRQVLVSGGRISGVGSTPGFVVTLTDVTQLRHLEQLHESEERFKTLFNASPVPMAIFSEATSRVFDVNDAFVANTGHERLDAAGRRLRDLGLPAQRGEWRKLLRTIRTRGRVTNAEITFRTKSGELRDGAAAIKVLPTGNQQMCVLAVNDVTDRKRAEVALASAKATADAANRAKSEFLSRMSHELRTPLNVVLGFGQVLELGELRVEQREAVGHIRTAGRHLLDLIEDVLDISGIEAGRMRLSMEPVDLGQIIDETVQLMGPVASSRHVGMTVLPPDGGQCWAQADRHRLKQVMLNLLSNAIKYNREGGSIAISYDRVAGEAVAVSVRDTGIGIPAEQMHLLFQPFERLGAEATRVEGSGLGLALSKRLLQTMDGSITGESIPGSGSTFTFTLAGAAPNRLESIGPSPGLASAQLVCGPRTIVYIEDNLANVALVEYVLKQWPAVRLISTMQGRLGVELAREHHPDLVLLDLNLPDIGGGEVLRQLKSDVATANIPVLVVSADASAGQIERLRAEGAADYLTKPLDVARFAVALAEILNAGRPGRAA
ncbi:MAG TPA: ATP-binding protein [Tepidiformaceae bacterium]